MSSPPPPHPTSVVDDDATIARHARYGMVLFILYVIIYAGFVLLAAFRFEVMKQRVGGVNLAIAYGFGLIVAAFALALLYMVMCRTSDAHADDAHAGDERRGGDAL